MLIAKIVDNTSITVLAIIRPSIIAISATSTKHDDATKVMSESVRILALMPNFAMP